MRFSSPQHNKPSKSWPKSLRRFAFLLLPVVLLVILLIAAAPGAIQREHKYREAVSLLQDGNITEAEQILSQIPTYRDSNALLNQEIPYRQAVNLFNAAKESDTSQLESAGFSDADLNKDTTVSMLLYQAASERFVNLQDYKDADSLAFECINGIETEKQRLIEELRAANQQKYDSACALLNDNAYSDAFELFRSLGGFSDSADMMTECKYRKALSIYDFLCRYDVSRISASITIEPGKSTVFSLSSEEALRLGSECVDELRLCNGKDQTDIRLSDTPDLQLIPLKDALSEFLLSLGSYKDSMDYLPLIEEQTDYTRDFFMLCSAGSLNEAKTWLDNFSGVFPDRERWSDLLDMYLPYCGNWDLYLGDSGLLAYSVGQSFTCMTVTSKVMLTHEDATLRLSFGEGNLVNFDLPSSLGETLFINPYLDSGIYMAAINNRHLVYMLYNQDWTLLSSCDYIPS